VRWTAFLAAAVLAALLSAPSAALAWKPFAHNYIGDQAYADATDDGKVTIGGRSYPLAPELVTALKKSRSYFNAGVVGPDGFPDLAFGQAQIHPEQTGAWLKYIFDKAWAAQRKRGPGYATAEERGQILAFAYGFLTHAAGDMWGHTLVNDFAGGLFPSFADLTNPDPKKATAAREIALRHVVAEGYAGAATPGWDRSTELKDRTTVCRAPGPAGTRCNDISNDTTHGIPYAAPHRFLYDILVNPRVDLPVGTCGDGVDDDGDGTADDGCPRGPYTVGKTPEPQRGALIDFFLDSQADLEIQAARLEFDATSCPKSDPRCERTQALVVPTIRGDKRLRVARARCTGHDPCTTRNADGDHSFSADFLHAWVDDIESGLKDWSRLGLAITRALFDPQAHRDAQNDACDGYGEEPPKRLSRGECEQRVGAVDTLVYKTRSFVDDHLLSMLGVPDWVVYVKKISGAAFDALADVVDKIVGPALNPLRELEATIKSAITGFVKTKIVESTGIDPDRVADFLHHPGQWMCSDTVASFRLPGIKNPITLKGYFGPGEHARLDKLIGLPANHHASTTSCSPLRAERAYDYKPEAFAAIKDSITQAKLLLLDGRELNRAFSDVLYDDHIVKSPDLAQIYPLSGRPNIMFTPLAGTAPWLTLIDGDHAWRQDGLPRFCDNLACTLSPAEAAGLATYATPAPRPAGGRSTGGNGEYPPWESCVLRPAFRALFTDWENPANPLGANFPDLGDPPSPSLADRFTPGVSLRPTDLSIPLGATIVLRPGARFTAQASDTVFTDGAIKLAWKLYRPGADPASAAAQPVLNGGTFALPPTATGDWIVEVTATDGCGSRPRTQRVQII
jgi:hypothetical protein